MQRRPLALVLLGLLFLATSHYMLWSQTGLTVVAEAFPVGLVAGTLLVLPRRLWWLGVTLAMTASTGLYLLNGREPLVAVGWALAATVGARVVAEVITCRGTGRPELVGEDDLRCFVTGSLAGAVTAAAIALVTSELAGLSEPWIVLLAVAVPHFASYLVIVPHFMGRPRFPGVAPLSERVIQWVATVLATFAVFLPLDLPVSMAFVVLPFLGWAALRAPMRETLVQLLVVATITHAMTAKGFGPLAPQPGASPVVAEMLAVAAALFTAACALVAIPFALAVGVQRREGFLARREEAKVAQLVQSAAGIAIIGTDAKGRIDLFNPGAQALLGYSAEEVMGKVPALFFSAEQVQSLAESFGTPADFFAVAQALAIPEHAGRDLEFLHKDGSVRTLQVSISRMLDAGGKVIGFVSTGEDVTRRVQQQRALEDALAAERLAVENLREVDQVKDAFVSGVSHELRTPITSILGYLEMLEEGGFGPLQASQVKALGRVKGNSRRLLSLIDDLLTLSRIQDGSLAVATCQLDLRDVVTGAHEEMSPGLLAAGIDFTCTVPDREVFVVGDEERLGRVLINLLGNAAKFTDRFGKVDLSLEVDGGLAIIAVRDTGIGIPATEQAKLFDRFFRSSVAHERAIQGSGLGLSIARAIVETHGGLINVESGEGVGSTFRVRLPLEGADSAAAQELARIHAQESEQDEYDDTQGAVLAS